MTSRARLESDVRDFMVRSDYNFDTILTLCESRIRKDVRIRQMETTTDLTLATDTVALPTDFISARRIYFDSANNRSLDYVPPETFYKLTAYGSSGAPVVYTIEGTNLVFAPAPADSPTAKMLYFAAFSALADPADTNWLIANSYEIYLYGCLMEAKAWIEDDAQLAKWSAGYDSALKALNKQEVRSRRIGPLKRVGGVTP